jgi:hypothetical protein
MDCIALDSRKSHCWEPRFEGVFVREEVQEETMNKTKDESEWEEHQPLNPGLAAS